MGTSQSKPSAKGGSPLVPSWANQDPPPVDPNAPAANPPSQENLDNGEILEPRRNSGMRRALKRFIATGDRAEARKALGHFSRGSAGGGVAGSRRLSRAARIGGGAISALSQAAAGQNVAPNGFDLNTLSGLPVARAIDAIVDAFCPPGIVDEDAIRAAIGEALAEALAGLDQFDPTAINDYTVLVTTRTFIAELVFGAVAAEQGQSAENVGPQQAMARENDLRALVREITDAIATPILQAAGRALTQDGVATLVTSITTVVYEEMSAW
jgi:hypothetical protein